MGQVQAVVDNMVNDEQLLNWLARLDERWADERGYEDFAEYEKAMRGLTDHEFIRATKRPFGFVVKIGRFFVSVYLKKYRGYCVLAAKSVKK